MELLDSGIEINEDFIPNSNLTYEVWFDGDRLFKAVLEDGTPNDKRVGFEDAPKTLRYRMVKPLSDFTDEEKQQILDYRGLNFLEDGFEAMDVFMEKSYVELIK